MQEHYITAVKAKSESSTLTTFVIHIVSLYWDASSVEASGTGASPQAVHAPLEVLARHMLEQMPWLHVAEVRLLLASAAFSTTFNWEGYRVPDVPGREIVVRRFGLGGPQSTWCVR